MSDVHFEQEVLQRFLLGSLDPDKNRAVVRHLLRGCVQCKQRTEALWPPGETGGAALPGWAGAMQVAREREKAIASERKAAPGLLDRLNGQPFGRQLLLVQNSRRFRSWAFCELLLERAWESRFDSALTSRELAELGMQVAERLDPKLYGGELVGDLKARAWAYLGNALRIGGDLSSAREAIRKSETHLRDSSGDPLETALVLEIKAILEAASNHLEEAERILNRVLLLYERAGDSHAVGTVLAQQGWVRMEGGDLPAASLLIRRGLERMDPGREPRRTLVAFHNLVFVLNETGESQEAIALLETMRPLYEELGDRLQLLRLIVVEGEIALRLGDHLRAEEAFLDARDGFIEQGVGYEAALASLQLATLYARHGRSSEMRELAEDIFPISATGDLPHGAMAAMIIFQQAAEGEAANLELIQEITGFMEKARDNPELEFHPPGS